MNELVEVELWTKTSSMVLCSEQKEHLGVNAVAGFRHFEGLFATRKSRMVELSSDDGGSWIHVVMTHEARGVLSWKTVMLSASRGSPIRFRVRAVA